MVVEKKKFTFKKLTEKEVLDSSLQVDTMVSIYSENITPEEIGDIRELITPFLDDNAGKDQIVAVEVSLCFFI